MIKASEQQIQEVVNLLERLTNPSKSDLEDMENLLDHLTQLVPHPAPSDFIFWPKKEMTLREIAIELFSYQPIVAGYTSNDR